MSVQTFIFDVPHLGGRVVVDVNDRNDLNVTISAKNINLAELLKFVLGVFGMPVTGNATNTSTSVAAATQAIVPDTAVTTTASSTTVLQPVKTNAVDDISFPNLSGAPKNPPDLGAVNHLGEKVDAVAKHTDEAVKLVDAAVARIDTVPTLLNANVASIPADLGTITTVVATDTQAVQQSPQNTQQVATPQQQATTLDPAMQATLQQHFDVVNQIASTQDVCGISVREMRPLDKVPEGERDRLQRRLAKLETVEADVLLPHLKKALPETAHSVLGNLPIDQLRMLFKNVLINQLSGV